MVYRGLPLEEAEKRYAAITNPPAEEPTAAPAPAPAPVVVAKAKPKRKVVKPATAKST
jgi:hypothetical protein